MSAGEPDSAFAQGEFRRTLDQRFRLSIPQDLLAELGIDSTDCLLAKERPGALSLWPAEPWEVRQSAGIAVIRQKQAAGRFADRIPDLQTLGRLLSTRQRRVQLAGRGRLVIPEGFREFLGVPAGGDTMVIGAAVCIEIWQPAAWTAHLSQEIERFHSIYDDLAG